MYDDLLVPVDESAGATTALEHAREIAERFGSTVHVLNVANTNRDSVTVVGTDVVDALEHEGEGVVEEVATDLRDAGIDCRTEVLQGDPAATIADYAESQNFDLVVMPTHGRSGLSRYLLGSVTEKVVRLSPVPVLTVRMEEARTSFPYENVLLPTDGSEAATRAVGQATDLAAELDATLHVLSVVGEPSLGLDVRSQVSDADLREAAEETVSNAAETAADGGVERVVERVERGDPARTIDAYAEENDVDLVVMGTTGRREVDRILLGGVTEKVLRSSPVPVMTVRK
ncbi:universal stress protein [halophilic archaeon]|nr:universal stress protein [halophilic archaeon]